MTHEEIGQCRQRLIDIGKMPDPGKRNKAYIALAAELGASGPGGNNQKKRGKQRMSETLTKHCKPQQ